MKTRCLQFVCVLGFFTWNTVWGAEPVIAPIPAAPAAPANQPAAKPTPKIKFASLIHDFGKISKGDVTKAEFTFTNVGDAVLEITDVKPGCGCTTAGEWTRKVEPGKTGIIPLQFNSASFVGPVTKTATVTCNDPTAPTHILQLKAHIWQPIEVTPQWAILNLTSENPSNSVTVHIVNNLDQPVTLSDLECKNPGFAAELKTVKEGKEFDLLVKTIPPYPMSSTQGQITLKTSCTNMPVITISAWANVQQTIMVMPAQITLPPGPLPNKVTQTVSIRSMSTNPISLSEPTSTIKGAELQLTNFQVGKYFLLTATFPAGLQLPQSDKAELSFKTTHPQYPVVKVPVYQPLPAPPPAALQLIPQYAILYLSPESPSNATTIRITNHLAQPVAITNVECKNAAFGTELKTIQEGKEYQLIVSTVPPLPTNSIQGQIVLRTDSVQTPVLNVTAWANVQQTIIAMPSQLVLPPGTLTNPVTQTLWIRNNGTNSITLSDPEVNAKGVDVKVNTNQPGRNFNLILTFPAGLQITPDEKLFFKVKTSHPKYPEIKVPVVQSPARPVPPPMPAGPNVPASLRPVGR